ncbi:tRNA lysidine(34) synthetase TilS [Halobacillus shinanisalinarum]|uniref:tRNA(Ile)-lysidine synthase n=1 Tax=Halobacillus shinanisalinarum TaxID=2932258 RepID=A0ABY4GUI1_9BACI|nr:tRNA lysidine(34) synthetase TilS [Halobacillus shinanisalinarum]UOQ91370.1 tRNA lysidine(34) synthetase TilS [Halobacillus shinanisalinarum]
MIASVQSFIEKHQLIQQNQTVVAAVSGGPDSLALLHYLCQLKVELNLRIVAVSVDHGLRGETSLEDLRFVEQIASEWNLEFIGTSVDVRSYKKKTGTGTQEAARILRYQFFEQVMKEVGGDVFALGHHGDDQAETMIMQMTRSVRPESVQGMPVSRPFSTGKLIRPFLCLSKEDLLQYCSVNKLVYKLDESNDETDYTRNAFRKHVMPFLKEQNPKLHKHMQLMSERVKDHQLYMESQAEQVLETMEMSNENESFVKFSIYTFLTFPLALQRTAFHLILNYLYGYQIEEVSYMHEEILFNLLRENKPNAELDLPRGLKVIRAYDEVTLTFSRKDHTTFTKLLYIGDTIKLPDGSTITAEWSESGGDRGLYEFVCDSHHVKLPLIVRTRKPGDRIVLKGMDGSKKVKDIFIDKKVPASKREEWPLVTDSDGQVLWLVGLRKGGDCTRDASGTWLRLHYKNNLDT